MKKIEVVAAVILKDNKVFSAQRADKGEVGLKWEFPGGKVEPGELGENAIIREIKEELDINILVSKYIMSTKHKYKSFEILMHAYLCEIDTGEIILKEHLDSRWLTIGELNSVDWAMADLPIVEKLKESYI